MEGSADEKDAPPADAPPAGAPPADAPSPAAAPPPRPRRVGFERLGDDEVLVALRRVPFCEHVALHAVCRRFGALLRSRAFRVERLDSGLAEVGVIVMGGCPDRDSTAGCWLFAGGRWRRIAPMNEPRWSHGAVVLDGEVWVTGGMDDDHNALATVEVYSPVTDSWRSSEPMTVPRYGHGCGVVGGRLVVAGGFTDTGNGNGNLRTVDAFTGTAWIALPPMEKKPWDPTACVDGRGRLVVFGGLPAYIVQVLTHSDDRGYEWAMRSRAPRAWEQCGRNAATAVVVGGKILVIGGTSRRGSPFSVMQYDVDADEWSLAPPLPPEYGKHRSGAFRYYKAVELGEPGEGRVLVMHRDRFMLRRADGEWDRAPASMWMREFPMAGESGFLPYECAAVSLVLG